MNKADWSDPEEGLETVGYYVRMVCLNCGRVGPENFKIEGEEIERRENVMANCCDNPEKVYRSNAVVPVEDVLTEIDQKLMDLDSERKMRDDLVELRERFQEID